VRRDAELAGELRDRFIGAIGMERRPDRVSLAKRLEDLHRLRAPEIDRQVRRELVPEQDRALGRRVLQVVECLDPPAKKYAPGSDR